MSWAPTCTVSGTAARSKYGVTATLVAALFVALPVFTAGAAPVPEKRSATSLESDQFKKKPEIKKGRTSPAALLRRMERSRRTRRQAIDENIAAQIDTLQMLIDSADPEDPDLPKYLLTLGDVYWDKADTFYDRAYDLALERRIHDAGERGDKGRAAELRASQTALLDHEKTWRERAIQVYRSIETRFPEYADLDMVFYYLGYQLTQLQRPDDAYQYFKKILQQFPTSRYTPDALYHIGDYYFEQNRFGVALKFYEKAEEFPRAVAYAMALYKQGWCFYNMGDFEEALKRFLRVIIYAKGDDAQDLPFRMELERDARQDLVRAYAAVGSPDRALSFFDKIAPEIRYDLAETLAQMYAAEGQWGKSSKLYELLLRAQKDSPRRALYWLGIAENGYYEGDKEAVVHMVQKLMKHYRDVVEQFSPQLKDELEGRLEGLIKTAASAYHKEAEKYEKPKTQEQTAYLYDAYLVLFPEADDSYEVTWNLAVLNEQMGRWEVAADMYEKVIALRPRGEHAADAAKAMLLAYYKDIESEKTEFKDDAEVIDLDPKPYPERYGKVQQNAARYIEFAQGKDPDVAKAHYVLARVAYRYNHFDEAITHLNRILNDHRGDPLVQPAARMLLSSFALMHDIDNLHLYADQFAADPAVNKGELAVLISRIRARAGFDRCFLHEKTKQYVETARCFLKYVQDFPDTELKTRAYFHAAAAYNRAKLIEKAMETLGALYNDAPNDPLAPSALYSIAEIYRSIAIYSESARFYELYAQRHPKHRYVEKALQRAIIFRKALQNYSQSINNIGTFIRRFPNHDAIPRLQLERAILYRKAGSSKTARKELDRLVRRPPKGAPPSFVFQARLELGRTWGKMGKKGKKKAKALFDKNIKSYMDLPENTRRKAGKAALTAVAESHFQIGEMLLVELARIKFSAKPKKMKEALTKKLQLIKEAQTTFQQVISYGVPNWAIAGMARVGHAFEGLSKDIMEAPTPRRLRGDAAEMYRQTLAEMSEPIKQKAISAYRAALQAAIDQKWFNRFTRDAVDALVRLDYSFPFLKEYVVHPSQARLAGVAPLTGSLTEAEEGALSPPPAPEGESEGKEE